MSSEEKIEPSNMRNVFYIYDNTTDTAESILDSLDSAEKRVKETEMVESTSDSTNEISVPAPIIPAQRESREWIRAPEDAELNPGPLQDNRICSPSQTLDGAEREEYMKKKEMAEKAAKRGEEPDRTSDDLNVDVDFDFDILS